MNEFGQPENQTKPPYETIALLAEKLDEEEKTAGELLQTIERARSIMATWNLELERICYYLQLLAEEKETGTSELASQRYQKTIERLEKTLRERATASDELEVLLETMDEVSQNIVAIHATIQNLSAGSNTTKA